MHTLYCVDTKTLARLVMNANVDSIVGTMAIFILYDKHNRLISDTSQNNGSTQFNP